jgi:nucleolar protein 4
LEPPISLSGPGKSSMTSSVFVRNLPYGITQEELERIFSEVGPVKKVDVIKEKGKRKDEMLTRGFAFVKL